MDTVLTRKLFRNRYLKDIQPKVKHFQEGGLSSLTPKEKAIYAATLAAPLLQGKGRGLSSTLSSLGEGIQKLPATIMAVEKAKGSLKSVRTMTAQEIKDNNLPPGTIAQVKEDGTISVVSKPSAEQMKTVQGSKRVRTILSRIGNDYYKLNKPVGFMDAGRIRASIGKVGGSQFAKDYGTFKSRIQQATSFVTQAISGAAVSEQEAERITKLIPQVGDTEATFEAKLSALDSYFADAIAIAEDNNADFETALEIMEKSGKGASNYIDLEGEVMVQQYDGNKYDVSGN
jgi:hypothetical protein|tara:strand:- start:2737 stop:3597 length:861 start_codon:yes stop_codon:yes gene_type:complete